MITNNQQILSWIKGYEIELQTPVVQLNPPPEPFLSESEKVLYLESINNLLAIGAVSKCTPCKNQFISKIFLIPKPNGKSRFILNLKELNKFIETFHFKLEDLRTALNLISQNCFMATLDLKDAYFLIKIGNHSKKYLRFIFQGDLYEFNVLPFGLNTAPFIFTKIMKPVIKLLRSAGLLSSLYLDDYFLIGNSFDQCVRNVETTKKLLTSLGFIINEEKSNLNPTKSCKFLGVIINSIHLIVYLPPDKKVRIKSEIQSFLKLKRCKIRLFARLVGLLVSACNAVDYGWAYTKQLERCKFLNLKENNNFDSYMNIPDYIIPDLLWWLNNIDNSIKTIKNDNYCIEIFSDASTTGWGAACNGEATGGQWSTIEKTNHINYLEILAAFLALKCFAKVLQNCQILLRIDNTTAISYINRMGGVQYPHLTQISRSLWQWCEQRKIYVYASYIPSRDNTIADAQSRKIHPDIEFTLSTQAFTRLIEKFGQPDIDLFASRLNTKCTKYISYQRDPDAWGINAFTINWSTFYFYAFPPFSIILKVLRKIIQEKARGIIVVPVWPTQPWFPIFKALLVSDTVLFSPDDNSITFDSSVPRLCTSLSLVAGVLYGGHFQNEAYLPVH